MNENTSELMLEFRPRCWNEPIVIYILDSSALKGFAGRFTALSSTYPVAFSGISLTGLN